VSEPDWAISEEQKARLVAEIFPEPPPDPLGDQSARAIRAAELILEMAEVSEAVALKRTGTLESLAAQLLGEARRAKKVIDQQSWRRDEAGVLRTTVEQRDWLRVAQHMHDFGYTTCEILGAIDLIALEVNARRSKADRRVGQERSAQSKRNAWAHIDELDKLVCEDTPDLWRKMDRAEAILKKDPSITKAASTIARRLDRRK